MEMSYLKLNAKKRMVKNHFKCFAVSILPFVTILLLTVVNYYLLIMLKETDFSFNRYISLYAEYIRPSLLTLSLIISFCLWKSICLFCESFFLLKTNNRKVSFKRAIKNVSFRQCVTFWVVSVIRFFLSVSWSTVYLSPCAAVSFLLIYCYRYENYGFGVNLTLFIASVLLFVIGFSYLYVTLKRYSMCASVILTEKEKDSLKVIAKSISIMEGNCVRYALYCLSFAGWVLSCILIIPLIYVVPFVAMGKWCFMNSLGRTKQVQKEPEKPIIFYIPKKLES